MMTDSTTQLQLQGFSWYNLTKAHSTNICPVSCNVLRFNLINWTCREICLYSLRWHPHRLRSRTGLLKNGVIHWVDSIDSIFSLLPMNCFHSIIVQLSIYSSFSWFSLPILNLFNLLLKASLLPSYLPKLPVCCFESLAPMGAIPHHPHSVSQELSLWWFRKEK